MEGEKSTQETHFFPNSLLKIGMYQVGNYQKFVISSATGRAYTMLRQIQWCYSETLGSVTLHINFISQISIRLCAKFWVGFPVKAYGWNHLLSTIMRTILSN